MKKFLNDTIWGKVLKTFIEGFIASLVITLPTINSFKDIEVLKAIGIGAVAMGISAVLNLLQGYLDKRGGTTK